MDNIIDFKQYIEIEKIDIKNTIEYKDIITILNCVNKPQLIEFLNDIINIANKKIFNIGI
jgi:hypothetical protein